MTTVPERVLPYDAMHADGLGDWRYQLGTLIARFETGGLAASGRLAQAIGEAADGQGLRVEVDLRGAHLVVRTSTPAIEDVSALDLELARAVSALAAQAGAAPRPALTMTMELAIDTVDADAIRGFWQALLGYEADEWGDLHDPEGQHPRLWFQEMDPPRTQRNRIHFDLNVPHDGAQQRVAAALAAGGTLVSDDRAPAFWVLADADGNEVCVCTWQNRPDNGEPA